MPLFVLLTKLTSACKEKLRDEPDILEEICGKLEGCDQRGLPQLATLSQYNFINIIDVKEEKTVYRLALELNSRGDVETTVLPALLMKDYLGEVRKMRDKNI
jgi:uncharacterized protein with GYD domain